MPTAVDGAPGGALERVDPIAALSEKPLYDTADARKLAAFKNKCRGLNDVEVALALEMIGSLGLNPWANEVYAAKGQSGNLLIMVGRDGLLRKAEEFPDYQGYDCGVVYEGDEFFKDEPDPDGKTLRQRAGVRHRQGVPKAGAPILGAWAVAERRGRPPRYFFARFDEYLPDLAPDKLARSPWGKQPSVMIEKVPISVVHRTLCNLSGVYLPEEAEAALNPTGDRPISREEEHGQIAGFVEALDGSQEVKDGLLAAVREVNALSPGAWGLAKCQMVLAGQTEEELSETTARIREEIDAYVQEQERRAKDEEIEDAVVVPEESAAGSRESSMGELRMEEVAQLHARREALVEKLGAVREGSEEFQELSYELDAVEGRLEELTVTGDAA